MHLSNTLPHNNRIEIADVLRGFAVMGITLIHFIERFSLNSFPEETCNFLIFTDRVIWDSVFFTFSGKASVTHGRNACRVPVLTAPPSCTLLSTHR